MADPRKRNVGDSRRISTGTVTEVVRGSAPYWRELLPGESALVSAINQQALQCPVVVPLADCNTRLAGTIATATDYFVGLSAGDSLIGVFLRSGRSGGDRTALSKFLFLLVQRLRADDRQTSRDALFASLLVLAQVDATFRSIFAKFEFDYVGVRALDPERDSIRSLRRWLLARVPLAAVREAEALGKAAVATLRVRGRAIYNPGFADYGPFRESDCDLISGGTLVEIKSLGKRGFATGDIRQLMAYCLHNTLSRSGREVRAVALCNPRRTFLWQASLEDFSRRLSGVGYARLAARARRDFSPYERERLLRLKRLRWLKAHGW